MASHAEMYNSGLVPGGSRIVLIVSKGPNPTQGLVPYAVPDVRTKNQGAALEELAKAGKQTQVVYDYHKLARKGEVVAQYPRAGAVSESPEALIIVSSGQAINEQAPVRIPMVVGKPEAEAFELVKSAGLSPQIKYEYSMETPEGQVLAQVPDNRSYATGAPKKKAASWVLIVLLAVLVVVGSYFIATQVPQLIEKSRPVSAEVVVPALVGKTQKQATDDLEKAGLKLGKVEVLLLEGEKDVPGVVHKTDPEAGKTVARGSAVNLQVFGDQRAEEPGVITPNFIGMTEKDANALAKRFHLKIKREESSNAAPAGSVFDQSPKEGTELEFDDTVTLYFSTGPAEATTTQVPSLIGSSSEDAQKLLKEKGFEVVLDESSNAAPKGQVFDQNPAAGTEAEIGSKVTITVSTGPAEAPQDPATNPPTDENPKP